VINSIFRVRFFVKFLRRNVFFLQTLLCANLSFFFILVENSSENIVERRQIWLSASLFSMVTFTTIACGMMRYFKMLNILEQHLYCSLGFRKALMPFIISTSTFSLISIPLDFVLQEFFIHNYLFKSSFLFIFPLYFLGCISLVSVLLPAFYLLNKSRYLETLLIFPFIYISGLLGNNFPNPISQLLQLYPLYSASKLLFSNYLYQGQFATMIFVNVLGISLFFTIGMVLLSRVKSNENSVFKNG